jgi:hypothetical protein
MCVRECKRCMCIHLFRMYNIQSYYMLYIYIYVCVCVCVCVCVYISVCLNIRYGLSTHDYRECNIRGTTVCT